MLSLWQPPEGDPQVKVEVIDYGAGDRQELRHSFVEGATQQLDVRYQVARASKRRSDRGKRERAHQVMPMVTMFVSEEVGPVAADGSAMVTLSVDGSVTQRVDGQTEDVGAVQEQLTPLMHSQIVMRRTPRGLHGRIGVTLPSRSNDVMLRPLLRSVLPPMIVFPRDPVGPGARWRATMANTLEGIPATTTITYSLDRVSSGAALIDGVVSMVPSAAAPASRNLLYESRFHVELDMSHAIPRGTVRQRDQFLLEDIDGVVEEKWSQSVLAIRPPEE
jgi:hypothetical protein